MMGGENSQCFLERDTDNEGRGWGFEWMQPEPEVVGANNDARTIDTTKEGHPDWLQPS